MRVIHVHPNESSVSKHIEGVNGWYDEEEGSDPFFPRHVQYCDCADKQHHGLDGSAGEDEVDSNHAAISEKKF